MNPSKKIISHLSPEAFLCSAGILAHELCSPKAKGPPKLAFLDNLAPLTTEDSCSTAVCSELDCSCSADWLFPESLFLASFQECPELFPELRYPVLGLPCLESVTLFPASETQFPGSAPLFPVSVTLFLGSAPLFRGSD